MLLICPVRPGDSNEELRFALRSWETNLDFGTELDLWTVGHKPPWLAPDRHIEGNRYDSMPLAVFDNIREGARAAERHRSVVFMNDDFFCLDPVGAILPVRRNVTLREQLKQFPPNAGMWWPRSLRATLDWLNAKGVGEPLSYEVHRPLICNPAQMRDALDEIDIGDTVPQWRTVYGNLYAPDAYPVQDCKLGLASTGFGTPWVSTADQTWRRYAGEIVPRFQKRSRWESDHRE